MTKIKVDIPQDLLDVRLTIGHGKTCARRKKLLINNRLGKEVASLVNQKLSQGSYEVEWNATGSPSGIYFYRLKMGDYLLTKRMILLK